MAVKNMQLGQILLEHGLITQQQLEHTLQLQKQQSGKKLGDIFTAEGIISELELIHALEAHFKVPYIDLAGVQIDPKAPTLLPEEIAQKYTVLPIAIDGHTLTVATTDPLNYYALDDIRLATNMEIKVVLSTADSIRTGIGRFYSSQEAAAAADDLSRQQPQTATIDLEEQLGDRIDNAPVVRLVNSIITQGVKLGASDIHIEPLEQETRVRVRIDGVLQNLMVLPPAAHALVITRLKIMSDMNIAERRIPQDGRIEMDVSGNPVDLRLSTLPTVTGEKIVIRVLGGAATVLSRSQLGITGKNASLFDRLLKSPSGIVLVSGPTGSGKTTTLYSVLKEFDRPQVNIITVEDPVEFRLPGINQVQINPKAGLTFASGLRSILRQDPDIIMVGEIRDQETAEIAVRSAITGHLVLSTVHTNDAVSSVTRLVNMGIEPYLLSSALVGVVAQRLVRKTCTHCATQYIPSADEKRLLHLPDGALLTRGTGCNYCGQTGYKGRTGIYEIMPVDKALRVLIEGGASEDNLRAEAVKSGMITLHEGCAELVRQGVTTVKEMLRVTYQPDA
ncbi:MAG: GspE/PulE family protein [Ethanoligenens sp.]